MRGIVEESFGKEGAMHGRENLHVAFVIVLLSVIVCTGGASANEIGVERQPGGLYREFVTDGSTVHDVGVLHMHVGNWGMFGSFPSSGMSFSHAPSAEWPAGSGIEHLYGAGLWVGAVKGGIPAVSTALFEMELAPTDDPIDTVYRSFEGAPGGTRVPLTNADDDHDGTVDEDFLDGRDNDGDGLIDEDFAAVSNQMFSCWYTDDQPFAIESYPDHEPLHITIRQESYQWEDPRFDDFVGATFTITNTGADMLEDVYLGIFADFNVGSRYGSGPYWNDDAAGFWTGSVCTDIGPATIRVMYAHDEDGEGGPAPGYFGVMVLDHTVDPLGINAPRHVGIRSYRVFSGMVPYENGGDPTNDFQRYETLARSRIDRNSDVPGDYRALLSVGPFTELPPGESIVFSIGFVAGEGFDGMVENAAAAQRLFDGIWYDLDGDPLTGIDRRETPIHGPAQDVVIDECRVGLDEPIDVPAGSVVWINGDCSRENGYRGLCGYGEADSLLYCTGVAGREAQLHWLLEPPPPMLDVLDIRPGRCPNRINARWCHIENGRWLRWWPALRVAITGHEDFDVRLVDIGTVRLEGVRPLLRGRRLRDVSRPVADGSSCACVGRGPDGFLDLILKFSVWEIARRIAFDGIPAPGEERILTLTGRLVDGSEFSAVDCLTFVGGADGPDTEGERPLLLDEADVMQPRLLGAAPNPFNPVTRITYSLPERLHVKLAVYDVTGRPAAILVNGVRAAGTHTVEWDARGHASGLYVYRLEAGRHVSHGKLLLIR
jgi:hypothetical protein